MAEQEIIPQVQFESLDYFIKGEINYHSHFLKGNRWGESRREHPHFIRFKELNPELEMETTQATLKARGKLPYEILFETYQLMSQLVYVGDADAMEYNPSNQFLIS